MIHDFSALPAAAYRYVLGLYLGRIALDKIIQESPAVARLDEFVAPKS